jgi:nicotinamidase-related amidase
MATQQLPVPSFFEPTKVGQVWQVPYQERAVQAREWARQYNIRPAETDKFRICLMSVDTQNTFCIPGYELFVGGRSGNGAVDDNIRLARFVYRELCIITQIAPTMDTHTANQIFHPIFWVNAKGEHPAPYTLITAQEVLNGTWRVNPAIAHTVAGGDYTMLDRHARHYVQELERGDKYALTIWPWHAMLGGIGHALVAALEEAFFFHNIARYSQTNFQIKGSHPLTEHYSVLRPEVLTSHDGKPIAQKNTAFINTLLSFDVVIIAGQAKSHCVAWTIDDLLNEIYTQDPELAKKVYLLEDCTSPVVVPGVVDYTDDANRAFDRFRDAGMHVVKSTDPIESWPGVRL